MDFSRIYPSVAVEILQQSHVTMVGGAYNLCNDLARCGVGSISLVDFDTVSQSNIARQDFSSADIAQHKVEVVAERLRRTNPEIEVETYILNYCALSDEEHDRLFGHTNLFIFSTDFFPAQAKGNQAAIRLQVPASFIGLYAGGRAGEVIFWYPGVTPACYRCICKSRYQAFTQGQGNVSSTGGTIFDLRMVDAVAGQIDLGLLTRGEDNRYGHLIDQLGNRNLLQIKNDPTYTLNGRDIFRQYLGDNPANFSFTTIALPMEREPDCPDCAALHNTVAQNITN
ncbi:MAG: ThiF family adenylyltransferase [Sedimentisphaerales bacterium]|nr:ThiF family adenylyltransferase [Sedimentisphaerales bacterium]